MSGSDRGNGTPHLGGFGIAAALIICTVVAGVVSYSTGRESERRYQSPHDHAETAKASAKSSCVGIDPVAVFECVYEKVEASEETARSEQDLDAQQWMAFWALAMTLVSAMTAVISAFALYFLRGTLDETRKAVRETAKATSEMRKANQIADDTARRQQRAYIAVRPLGVEQLHSNRELIGMVSVENVGQTPAMNVDIYVNMFCSSSKTETHFPVKANDTGATLTIQPNMNVRKGSNPDNIANDAASNFKYIYVYGVVLFDDEFCHRRQTWFCHRYATVSRICDPSSMILVRADSPKTERMIFDPVKARFHFKGNISS
jgi:hypothetical protein